MPAYRVQLDVYQGPTDLLLYLVRKQELDIREVSISLIVRQYLEFLVLLRTLDMEPAADFLVLAATLMEIKSESLLPRPPEEEEVEAVNSADPKLELVKQLLMYKKFKDAARALEDTQEVFLRRRGRPNLALPGEPVSAEGDDGDFAELEVWDLVKAFARLMEDIGAKRASMHEIDYRETPVETLMEEALARLEAEGPLTLEQLIEPRRNKGDIIGMFFSLLELTKQRMILIEQSILYGVIRVRLRDADERGHEKHEAMLAARDAAAETAAREAEAAGTVEAEEEDDPALAPMVFDDIDPDLLDDEVNRIAIPEIDLNLAKRGRRRKGEDDE